MSDPEDVQSDEDQNMSTGEWIYQLRRIGPPATLAKMPDVMRLNLGLTKIGRGQHNDYILDSAVLKNFISRSHVEIYGKKNENGEIEFVLTDKGLNGTFINDIRTHKTCTMEVGDKITFGHTNGYKIQPGSYAEQSQSEFQFQFEKVPRNSKTTEMFSEVLQPTHTPVSEERPEIIPDLKKDTTIVSDRQFLSDLKSNLQSQEKSAKSRTSQKGRSRRDSYSSSDNDIDTSKNSSSVKEKKRNSNDSNSKSPVLESGSSRKTLSSGKGVFSETLPAQDDDFSDEIEDEEEEVSEDEREKKKKKGPKKGKASIHKKPVVKRKVPDPPSESEESSEEDESSKPEADQRPKSHTQASKLKQPKKKKVGNDAPAVGSRKRRRKGGAAPSSTATTSSELEPGVEWYEDDTCDSPDCKRPKKKKTPWVQCDDCDGWYHTMCVGANYNKLKDSDEHFNCGCE